MDKQECAIIKGLHHSAYRCRDSERTRQFYEDFLGLPLVEVLAIEQSMTGRSAQVLHSFFQMADGSCLAFFEVPDAPFTFKPQHDYDLHVALTVDHDTLQAMFRRGQAAGIETRGISDHGFIDSVYFRDPDGYVVELAAPKRAFTADEDARARARARLRDWRAARRAA